MDRQNGCPATSPPGKSAENDARTAGLLQSSAIEANRARAMRLPYAAMCPAPDDGR